MGEGVPAPLPYPPPSYNQFQRKKRSKNTRQEGDDIQVNTVIKHLLRGFRCNAAFRYFSLRIISFRIQNIPFRFEAKQAKQTFFFLAISLRSYSLPFRFVSHRSEIPGHPNRQCRHVFIIFPGIYPDQLKYRFSAVPNNLTSRYLIVRDKFAFVQGYKYWLPYGVIRKQGGHQAGEGVPREELCGQVPLCYLHRGYVVPVQ